MRINLFLACLFFASNVFSATIEIVKSGTGSSCCSQDNPRCNFDLSTRSECIKNAKSDAQSNAEYECSSKGGVVVDGSVVSSSSSKERGWVDSYNCSASYKVECNTNPAGNVVVSSSSVDLCKANIIVISNKLNPADVVQEGQLNSSCKSAVSKGYQDSLYTCLKNSLNQDTGAATSFALKYCDLAGKEGRIDDWISILPYYKGYNFRYIYEEKF